MSNLTPMEVDVCIIGGGIAGNYLASLLSRDHISVCVVEEHPEIGIPFQCAGIVSQKILKLVSLPPEIILNRISTARIVSPDHRTILVKGQENPVVIDRVKFDQHFAQVAQENGVTYLMQEKFVSFSHVSSSQTNRTSGTGGMSGMNGVRGVNVRVETNRRIINCHILVGADGPHSRVGKQLGVKNSVIAAAQIRARHSHSTSMTSMVFDPRWRELFGYIIPEGSNGVCRIGIGSRKQTARNLTLFTKSLGINHTDIVDRQGGVIPIGLPHQFVFDNIVLIGDATSFVKATTGGGIIMILSAAQILAPAIKLALDKGKFSRKFFWRYYQHPFKTSYGVELKLHYLIRIFLMNLRNQDYDNLFRFYKLPKIHDLIYNYADMDFPGQIMMRLLLSREFWRILFPLSVRYLKFLPLIIRIIFT